MKLEEIKIQVIDNSLLEIVLLMGQLRQKVNAVLDKEEEFEKLAGGDILNGVENISEFLVKSEADICSLIGTVASFHLDRMTNPLKPLFSPVTIAPAV